MPLSDEARSFLMSALATPSPSGYEQQIQAVVRDYIDEAAARVRTDVHGNVMAISADSDGPRLMYAGHCDQIGMIVSYIDEFGFVYANTIGGWDPQQLIGQAMTIWADGGPVPAVISRKPIHLLKSSERSEVVQLDQMWLDIGAEDQAAARTRVRIGDCITLDLRHRELMGTRISGPAMDNTSGMWVVMEAFRRAAERSRTLGCQLFSVSTVQEEIGLRGAKTAAGSIDPDVAIAVDVTHASDCPTIDKQQQGDIRLGGGPVIFRGPNMNPYVVERLINLAEAHGLSYQLAATGRATPNDANVLQVHGGGVATGLVAIPNRYMHSAVETIDTRDIDQAAELLALFAMHLTAKDDFIPRVTDPSA